KVAPAPNACAESEQSLTLIATERFPQFDPAATVFAPDDGRLDLRGQRLRGVTFTWKSGNNAGADTCRSPLVVDTLEYCTFAVGRGASADPAETIFTFTPGGGRSGADVTTFDSEGRRVPDEART